MSECIPLVYSTVDPQLSAKVSVMGDFLLFIDNSSQPNGRTAGSHGPTRYFISKFNSIRKVLPTMSRRLERSVVGEFCL